MYDSWEMLSRMGQLSLVSIESMGLERGKV